MILGWVDFDGLRIPIAPGVFVPRQRSIQLARLAVRATPASGTVLDLCCGAGAIGAVLRRDRPGARVVGSDIDPAAVACARRTLPEVYAGDLFEPLPRSLLRSFDVIVANAPYVPTADIALMPREARDHEPSVTLDGGYDGVEVHRRIAAEAGDWLAPGGRLLIETGRTQVERTSAAARAQGAEVAVKQNGTSTVVVATYPKTRG